MFSGNRVRVILRGDDCGGSHSANHAIWEACEAGTIRNVSVMAVGATIAEATEMFTMRQDICIGLHVTMNSEWSHFKWKPILSSEQVPSLVDKDGYFLPSPALMQGREGLLEQVILETKAQLDKLRGLGFKVSYADEHMFFGFWVEGFHEWFEKWCQDEGIINFHRFNHPLPVIYSEGLHSTSTVEERLLDQLQVHFQSLDSAVNGIYTSIFHPGYDNEEMRCFGNEDVAGADIAVERNLDRLMLTDPRLLDYYNSNRIRNIRYDEAILNR